MAISRKCLRKLFMLEERRNPSLRRLFRGRCDPSASVLFQAQRHQLPVVSVRQHRQNFSYWKSTEHLFDLWYATALAQGYSLALIELLQSLHCLRANWPLFSRQWKHEPANGREHHLSKHSCTREEMTQAFQLCSHILRDCQSLASHRLRSPLRQSQSSGGCLTTATSDASIARV